MAKKKPIPKKAPPKKRATKKTAKTSKPSVADLSPQQMRFAAAYARTGDGAASAIEAGYAPGAAKVQASRLLTRNNVRGEINRLLVPALDKAEASVERIVDELSIVAFTDIGDFVEWGYNEDDPTGRQVRLKPSADLDRAKRRGIIEVSEGQFGIKIKFGDKIGALNTLAKYRGMFVERHEVTIPPVEITLNFGGKA